MQPIKHNLILNPKHKIQSLYDHIICPKYQTSSNQFECYKRIEYIGTDYKAGYYLTRFEDEMCLYEITEIIIMINIETIIVCK